MADIKQYTVTEPFVNLKSTLGEGPYWEPHNNVIRWLDIEQKKIHVVDLDAGALTHKTLPTLESKIGVTADLQNDSDKFIFAGKSTFGTYDKRWDTVKVIKELWTDEEKKAGHEKRFRLNDGAVDPQGRFWAGTIDDTFVLSEMGMEGTLFRLDPDMSLHRMREGIGISNGISWTSDQKTMYYTDSLTQKIDAYDFDAKTGNISNMRTFFQVEQEGVVPDGHALDVEDHLWVALFGASKVVRISPAGKVVAEIQLPTRLITCPVFADDVLYITSAAEWEPETHPDSAKYGGSLFRCEVGVQGQKRTTFRADQYQHI